nr:hypothetical protein [Tanacetum cinerariifolium]
MSQEIVHIVVDFVDILDVSKSCVDECNKCLELKTVLLKKKDLIEKDDNSGANQNAPTFNQLFKTNELKAQSQEKDIVIKKLKDRIKSLSGKYSLDKVKKEIDEIEAINIELEHDEHCDSLIAQINAKSIENLNLNAQLQEKVFVVLALKNELRKLKGKIIIDTAISTPIATTIASGMINLDLEPISHIPKNNRDPHEVYLQKTIENVDTIRRLVEYARKQNPSEPLLDSACIFTKHVQEWLVYVSKTCPSLTKPSEKLVVVTPLNKDKKVRFADPLTSSSNTQKQVDSHITQNS